MTISILAYSSLTLSSGSFEIWGYGYGYFFVFDFAGVLFCFGYFSFYSFYFRGLIDFDLGSFGAFFWLFSDASP